MTAIARRRAAILGVVAALGTGGAAVALGQAPAASAAVGCRVDYTVNQWAGGFTADVKLTAGDTAWSSWTVTWTYPGDQKVTSAWNATATQAGAAVTAKNMSYNGVVPAGGSTSFGVQGTWTASDAAPTAFAVNGVACNGTGPTGAPSSSSPSPSPSPSRTASPTPTASPVGCGGAVVCDGFEGQTGTTPSGAWTTSAPDCSGTGTAAIDTSVSHSGGRSLRINGGGGYCNHIFVGTSADLASVQSLRYVRFYVRHTTALGAGHVTFVAQRDANDTNHDLRIGGQGSALQWNRSSDDATLPEQSPAGLALSVPLPTDRWSCLEFMVNGTNGTAQTWLDGTDVPGLHDDGVKTQDIDSQWIGNGTWRPRLTDFRLGWESYGNQTDTLWFDDVAISGSRIGC